MQNYCKLNEHMYFNLWISHWNYVVEDKKQSKNLLNKESCSILGV